MASRAARSRLVLCLALLLSTLMPASVHAENACPWLNDATASGLLGGTAVGVYTSAAQGQPAVCVFMQQTVAGARMLRLTVETVVEPHMQLMKAARVCGTHAVPLPAIGNEAVVCTEWSGKKGNGEIALGRVRDQLFRIALTSSLRRDSELSGKNLRMHLSSAAEQVAGNLF
ncbi:MAG TPA: hypothetical protein VG893_08020 [Terracidiphilus sp.]|nr:hypothetical protein [Terracidiphilus sp.]